MNVHETFRRRPGRLLSVLCTFNLRPGSTGTELKGDILRENIDWKLYLIYISQVITNFYWKVQTTRSPYIWTAQYKRSCHSKPRFEVGSTKVYIQQRPLSQIFRRLSLYFTKVLDVFSYYSLKAHKSIFFWNNLLIFYCFMLPKYHLLVQSQQWKYVKSVQS